MNSHKNHVKYNYLKCDEDFDVSFGQCTRKPEDFRTETFRTAEKIYSENKDICIGLSGGIDSEIVSIAFVECDYDIQHVVFKYKGEENKTENDIALSYAKAYGIKPEIIEIDPFDYFYKDVFDICEEFKFPFRTAPYLYWLNTKAPGTMISGSGLANVFQHPHKETEMCFTVSNCINPYNQLKHHNIESIPEFFFYTPEMMASVLCDPDVRKYSDIGWTTANPGLDTFKMYFIPKYYPDVQIRKKKYGFEKIRKAGLITHVGKQLAQYLKNYQVVSWEINSFRQALLGKREYDQPELIKDQIHFYA